MAIDIDRLKAALADRYAVEREIGQGGMATVYLAHDIRHGRQVAVKVVEPDLAAALGHERFVREIETAASLNHPHILGLHDSGEADGYLYYVMPYMAGESLRDRLEREGQLPVPDALQIAREVSDGLGYAHRQGIIHRDIKPGNILLSEGHAVIADFGIAKAIAEAGGDELIGTSAARALVDSGDAHVTQTGIAIGSPMYMSPEQANGDRALDGRSDIYSLGCVLYEMLAGEPPYTATSAKAVIAKHMTGSPTPLSDLRDTVPGSLDAAVVRSLSKEPADRFPEVEDLAEAISVASLLQLSPEVELPKPKGSRFRWSYALPVVLVSIAFWGNSVIGRSIGAQASDQLQTILDGNVAAIEVWMENQVRIGSELAQDPAVRSSMTTLVGVGADPSAAAAAELAVDPAQDALRKHLNPIAESLDYMGFAAYDSLGRVVAATEDILLGYRLNADSPAWKYLGPVVLDGRTVVSPPLPSLLPYPDEQGNLTTGRPIMALIAPIRDSQDRVIAALVLRIPPEDDFTRLLQVARFGESGETYVFTQDGLLVSESRFDDQLREIGLLPVNPDARGILNVQVRDPGGNMLDGYRPDVPHDEWPLTTMAASATAGQDGFDFDGYRDYRGVRVVGVWRWLPEHGIGITTKIDKEEAYGLQGLLRNILGLTALLLGFLFVGFLLFRGLRRLRAR